MLMAHFDYSTRLRIGIPAQYALTDVDALVTSALPRGIVSFGHHGKDGDSIIAYIRSPDKAEAVERAVKAAYPEATVESEMVDEGLVGRTLEAMRLKRLLLP